MNLVVAKRAVPSGISGTGGGEQGQARKTSTPKKENAGKDTLGDDYWERVADDAASGYKNKDDEDNILNVDQVPGDNERGDKAEDHVEK